MLTGYRAGVFAMEVAPDLLGWFSPDPRGVLVPSDVHVSRSMRRWIRRYRVSIDQEFAAVVAACANPDRSGAWITQEMERSYQTLHQLGWAHSVEVWDGPQLVGGLFGVESGGLFAGESMFHRAPNASKLAVIATADRLAQAPGPRLFDVQWWTPHLGSLGAVTIGRADYLAQLADALDGAPAFLR
ncbi:MAG: leucyl/phenylalanyl-tRNA--protein transferase [Actinomycetia bacterium]|nr:leucyl/phenylalanyl-tRNA--protein transferase [Actinomycetes bacterium]